jgi:PIN domain nuclease of toxin-antitoxin system
VAPVIYLDTHVAIALHTDVSLLGKRARRLLQKEAAIGISPAALLEMQFLHEIGRIKHPPRLVIRHLQEVLDLQICRKDFFEIISLAMDLSWTRDPFDRIIVAHAKLDYDWLVTKDTVIQTNYKRAVW